MNDTPRTKWIGAAVLLGALYAVVGILFALPTSHVKIWRLAAWAVSMLAFLAHAAYERRRLGNPPGIAAFHNAVGVAIGGFGLAVGANVHSFFTSSTTHIRPMLALSLLIWPIITAVPAYLVGLVLHFILVQLRLGQEPT